MAVAVKAKATLSLVATGEGPVMGYTCAVEANDGSKPVEFVVTASAWEALRHAVSTLKNVGIAREISVSAIVERP